MLDPTLPPPAPTGSAPGAGPEQRRVHPLVRLDYPVRITAVLFAGLVVGSALMERETPLGIWLALGLWALVWPHVAFQVARRARDSKRAELRNLLLDSAIVGVWSALSGFDLLITASLFTAMNSANLSTGGARGALLGSTMLALGAALAGWFNGFAVYPATSALTTGLALAALVSFTTVFGIQSNIGVRRVISARRELEARNRLIDDQRRELETAWKTAEIERHAAEDARQLAVEASQTKSAFLANMSHELRTPLNAIIGYSEMLQEELADSTTDESVLADLRRIQGAGRHLLGLINDVLDLSKIEAGKIDLHFEPIDLAGLVQQVCSMSQPLLATNRNRLELSLPDTAGTIEADSTRLRQVLFNLVSNAAKFTQDGTVAVTVDRGVDGDGVERVRIAVRDTGIGLSEEAMARLFQPFVQADSATTRRYGGTGLGLVISRRLCRLMGGDVTVESRPGQGSCFTASVSVHPPSPTAAGSRADPGEAIAASRAPAGEPPAAGLPDALSDQRIRAVIEAAPVFLILWRAADDVVLVVSPLCTQLFGYRPDELVGQSLQKLYGAHSIDGESVFDAVSHHGSVSNREVRFLRADGTEFVGRVSAQELRYGGRTCLIAGVADVTDLHEAQRATQAVSAAKSRFLRSLSHGMRTQLNDIIGYADLLIETPRGERAAAEEAARIRDSGARLLGMLDTVMDYSRLDTGEMEVRTAPVELAPLLEEVRLVAEPLTERKGNWLAISDSAEVWVTADRTRLKQVLLQLISNATRHSGRDAIAVHVRPWGQTHIDIQVRDKGRGMTREALQRALDPFGSGAALVPSATGTGLGLAVSRGLCERMGGQFLAESEPGDGAAFTLRLQRASATSEAPGARARA